MPWVNGKPPVSPERAIESLEPVFNPPLQGENHLPVSISPRWGLKSDDLSKKLNMV